VEYLGHIISHEGAKVDPKKMKTIMEWLIPKSLNNIRGLLGLVSYYNKFFNNYGQIVSPLETLLKKKGFLAIKKQPKILKNLRRLSIQLLSRPHINSQKPLLWSVMPRDMALV